MQGELLSNCMLPVIIYQVNEQLALKRVREGFCYATMMCNLDTEWHSRAQMVPKTDLQ